MRNYWIIFESAPLCLSSYPGSCLPLFHFIIQ